MAARAQIGQAKSQLYPTLTTAPAYTRTKSPGTLRGVGVTSSAGTGTTGTGTGTGTGTSGTTTTTSSGTTATDLSLPFDVTWEPDLWGKIRNTIREYQYATQVSAADLENERLTEQAALAEFYFELRGQDALQDLYNRTIEADQKSLDLTKALVETGIDSPEAVAQAEVTLENAQEAGTGIATNRAIYEHAIATLIGKPASDFSLPVKPLTTPVPAIPIGVPSELLERRPDIAAAERTMAEANALIGVEKAAYYPTLSLSGSGGLESSHISSLFSVPRLLLVPRRLRLGDHLRRRSPQSHRRPVHRTVQRRRRPLPRNRPHRLPAGRGLHRHPPRHQHPDHPAAGRRRLRSALLGHCDCPLPDRP